MFSVPEINDDLWESQLNPNSEVTYPNALVDESVYTANYPLKAEYPVQFERVGYFVIDNDSDIANKKLVFNMTVSLKDSKPKVEGAPSRSRKDEQAKQAAEKLARMTINPKDMFTLNEHEGLYSSYDADGIPTMDKQGEPISKSMSKKLKKEYEKQKKLFESNKK